MSKLSAGKLCNVSEKKDHQDEVDDSSNISGLREDKQDGMNIGLTSVNPIKMMISCYTFYGHINIEIIIFIHCIIFFSILFLSHFSSKSSSIIE